MAKRCIVDVMGYHDGTDLPNYWAYASNFVLMDHFFESVESWSKPNHFAIFSGWSAKCTEVDPPNVDSCSSSFGGTPWSADKHPMPDLWTDITYLLYQNGISWGVYLDHGQGNPFGQHGTPGIWNVLPGFETVQQDGQVANAELDQTQFYSDAAAGTLPQVTWLLPEYYDSEHPQASIAHGQSYVTGLINAVMEGPDWNSSAIFVVYDDADGFYDHEPPPYQFDELGLGIRVPAWMISPYAKQGYIDHQVCSTDCYLTFIEQTFLNGESMSQAGRPDPRPDYRDAQAAYGDLANDFDFSQAPRRPLVLSTHPLTLLRPAGRPLPGRPIR
jgi:phospholipase C